MSHKLNFDSEMLSFINECRGISKIVDLIDYHRGEFLKKTGDFIKKEPGNDTISFIPKSKLGLEHQAFDDTKYRTPLKIALFSYVAVIGFLMATFDNLFGNDEDDEDFFAGL